MFKLSKAFIYVYFLIAFISCGKKIKKNVIEINREVFFAQKTLSMNDSIIELASININTAFNLVPIEHSQYSNEIRLHYLDAFNERFFIEKKMEDSTFTSLYNCKTINREDSLFMKIGTLITLNFKSLSSKIINSDSVPDLPKYDRITNTNSLDGGPTYFYQIKKGSSIKKGIIDYSLKPEKNNTDIQNILLFINAITEKYSFDFPQPMKNIIQSFFPK